MTDGKVAESEGSTRLRTAAGVAVGVVVGLGLIALLWRAGWRVPFVTGWISLKIAVKAGVLTVGGLIAFAAWRRKRRTAEQDGDTPPSSS
ncbi:hypothetical protein ACYTFC_28790 [Streptomyces globosus]|uniref:hypothetical protein n=1 Tax=Streptomyces sp. WAC05292 TaxID=2487418 RepID=UPI000F73687A|nr:hypothetical protein [Streptomyces sp. WAC05292]RSS85117.1 hypothetical protein EF903_22215 [Streptomyces sp. WAC05292]